jgi:hypothetical protein
MFFFEKKNQKTFASRSLAIRACERGHKSLLLLFFRKEELPSFSMIMPENCKRWVTLRLPIYCARA